LNRRGNLRYKIAAIRKIRYLKGSLIYSG